MATGYENKVTVSELEPSEKARLWTWHHDCELTCGTGSANGGSRPSSKEE